MPKMIQIRHVPDALHRRLKARAAKAGMSLSDYLRRELEQSAARTDWDDALAMLYELEPVRSPLTSVEIIEAGRRER